MSERKQKTKQSCHREGRTDFCLQFMAGSSRWGQECGADSQSRSSEVLSLTYNTKQKADRKLCRVQTLTACVLLAGVHLTAFTASPSGRAHQGSHPRALANLRVPVATGAALSPFLSISDGLSQESTMNSFLVHISGFLKGLCWVPIGTCVFSGSLLSRAPPLADC